MIEERLPTRPFLTLEVAQELVAAALAEAGRRELNKMVVAVTDAGGRLIAFARQDDAEPAAVDICIVKARTAAIFTRPTKAWKERLLSGDMWVLGMPNMHPIEGGQNIVAGGHTIGGLGVGGASGQIDSEIGTAALVAVLGEPS